MNAAATQDLTARDLAARDLTTQDLTALGPAKRAERAAQMPAHIAEQSKRITSQAQGIKWRDARIETIS